MSKYQSDRELFYGICKFFSSKAWWRPIMEFIYSNSRSFLNSLEYSTEDEHVVYIKFMNMITDLVDNYMCSKLHISSDAFENFMSQFLTKPNDKATVIFDTLRQATDYNEFCKQMHLCNKRIENSITRALLKYSEDESITSTDELAIFVAKQIEKDQNVEIDDLVHKACVQTKKMMGISVLNSSPKRKSNSSPLKPKPNLSEESLNVPLKNKNENNNKVSQLNQTSNKKSKETDSKSQKTSKRISQNENVENNDVKVRKQTEKVKNNSNEKDKQDDQSDYSYGDSYDDKKNELSEVSDEEESESDSLVLTYRKPQNRSFLRPPPLSNNRFRPGIHNQKQHIKTDA